MIPRLLEGALVLWAVVTAANRPAVDLFSDFEAGWETPWMERALARRTNAFRLDNVNDVRVLRVDSQSSASALWRPLDLDRGARPMVSWRWRVERSLSHIEDERRRRSDDYAARVAVMFDGKPFDRKTPIIIYVWAGNETVGNVYPSPYTDNAATVVLQSGDGVSGEWVVEERDVFADFERYFARSAERVTGVALMVDTDNTRSEATAWFDDLMVHGIGTR